MCVHATHTVGTYFSGTELVVYEIQIHVLPDVSSPTTTHFMCLFLSAIKVEFLRHNLQWE